MGQLVNNRETIAVIMTLTLFLGGVGLLTLGIVTQKEDAFVAYLGDLVDKISGGNIRLDEFDTKLPEEPFVFIIGGGVLMLLGFFGLCSVASRSSIFRNFYLLLLLLCFGAAVGVVVLAVLGNWGVDFRGENDVTQERFRGHWRSLSRSNQTAFESLLGCCDFDLESPRRDDAVWLGGCETHEKGCFIELLLVENSKKMASVFIWATVAFVILVFAMFNCMVDHAEI